MKKRKLLLLVPVASLFLSGCTFKEVKHAIGESWVGQHILHPVYDPVKGWIQDITGKEEKQGEGEKPTPEPEPVKVNYGTLEAPLSMKEFQETVDKLIDFEEVEEGTTVTHQTAPFYLKGKVVKNEAASNGKIRFTNLVDATDENVKVTGYYLTFGEGVDSATYGVADAMKGGEIVVKGYGMLYKKDGAKTYEIGEQSKEGEKGQILSVTMPEPTAEPEKLNRTLAEIVAGTPTKSQAYVSRAQIKYFASSGQAKTDESSEYGGMVITDGTNDVFVYGSSPVATDLSWNGTAGEYAYKSSKVFKTNDLTKDLQPGYYIDFYGIYFDYNGIKEMNLIITGAEAGELPPEVIPEGQTKVEKTATQLKEENDWVASAGQDVGTKFDGVDLDANIHVGFVGTGNTATYWTSGEAIRIYGDKGTSTTTVTFTGGEGVTIKSIKLTFSLTGNATFPLVSGTAADVDANSVTYPLTCAADANGQIRIAAFEVLYTGGVPTQKELQSISVTEPTDVDYFTGESLNTEGMVVMGHYLLGEEEVEEEIKAGYTLSQEGAFTENDIPGKTITVTYEGKTATFDVTVSKKAAELLNITIEGDAQTEYYHGDKYSLEGLDVYANYDDESKVKVTETANLEVSKETAEYGDSKVSYTASYEGKNAELEVEVTVSYKKGSQYQPYTVTEARGAATATAVADQYVSGIIYKVDSFNSKYGSITYWISDTGAGNSAEKDGLQIYGGLGLLGKQFESIDDLAVGDEVVVKGSLKLYNNTTYELDLNSVLISKTSPTVESVAVSGTAEETEYAVGTKYNHNGLVATATLSNGVVADVTDKAEWAIDPEVASADDESINVTATYKGVTSQPFAVAVQVSDTLEPSYHTATMTKGSQAYDDGTLNGKSCIKIGTSSKGGDMTITVPAKATELVVYAVAWKGVSGLSLNLSSNKEGVILAPTALALSADDGATGSSPYTLVNDEATYKFSIQLTNVTEETTIKLETSTAKRCIVWDAQYWL